jgi:hypothetical protein
MGRKTVKPAGSYEHGKASRWREPLRMSVSQWALLALNCRGLETGFCHIGSIDCFCCVWSRDRYLLETTMAVRPY